jgi:hypothetical protein
MMAAARAIDDERRRLHLPQRLVVDHLARLRH